MRRDVPAHLDVTGPSGRLRLTADGVVLDGGTPAARLLLGASETPYLIQAHGPVRTFRARRQTPLGPAAEATWSWRDDSGYVLSWTIADLDDVPGVTVRAVIYNGSSEPIRLRDITLFQSQGSGLTCVGDPAAWWLSSPTLSPHSGPLTAPPQVISPQRRGMWDLFNVPRETAATASVAGWRSFSDILTLYTARGRRGLVLGAVGVEADVRFDCALGSSGMRLQIVSEMTDVQLEPGEMRQSEEVLLLAGPYETAVPQHLQWLSATLGRRTHRGPITGWCSWYDQFSGITAAHVRSVVEAVQRLGDRLPLEIIQIDQGYERALGDWACNETFPQGWDPLVAQIRETGAAAGVWLAPLMVHDALGWLDAHPDWFQQDAAGRLEPGFDDFGAAGHYLDPTHPAVQDVLRSIIRQACAAGFRYVKIDYNVVRGRMHNPHKTRLQALRDLYRLYREEMGEEAYLLACANFERGIIGFADGARVGPDSLPTWQAETPLCLVDCISVVGSTALANGLLLAADPDVTYLRSRGTLTDAEQRTWHSVVGLLGGLVMTSEPLHDPAYADAVRMMEIVSPPSPERAWSFQAGVGDHTRFGFMATRPWGSFAAVLLWNPATEPADIALDCADRIAVGERFHVWSFWNETYLGIGDARFVARRLAPHGPALLRLTALPLQDNVPVLIGSTLHIAMGAAEIADVATTSTAITITLNDAGAREGRLYFYSQEALTVDEVRGCDVQEVVSVGPTIWAATIAKRRRDQRNVIRLRMQGGHEVPTDRAVVWETGV